MSILPNTFTREPIPKGVLALVARHARNRLYDVVIEKFIASGISSAQLARRLNMDPAQLSRALSNPQNWEIETLARIYYAICGEQIEGVFAEPVATEQDIPVQINIDAISNLQVRADVSVDDDGAGERLRFEMPKAASLPR